MGVFLLQLEIPLILSLTPLFLIPLAQVLQVHIRGIAIQPVIIGTAEIKTKISLLLILSLLS